MINTKLFLLLGTSLSFIPTLVSAQCVATQDCETLGYTETTCNGGKGVKCPFGNKWACLEECSDCAKLGFTYECKGTGEKGVGQSCNGKYQGCSCDSTYQYTCTGTGYAGGAGSACGGKYAQCKCAGGYAWRNNGCFVSNYTVNCCNEWIVMSCIKADNNCTKEEERCKARGGKFTLNGTRQDRYIPGICEF